jgi:hypothetical protein
MNKLRLVIFFMIITTIAVAQDDPIFTDRPNVTDAVSLISPGTFQVELGYYNTKADFAGGTDTYITAPNISLKYGLLDWLELRVLTNYGISKIDYGSGKDEVNGLTPITISPKFALMKQNGFVPKMAVATSFTFPDIGDQAFQVAELNYGFRLLFEYGFNKFSWTNSIGTDWPKGTDQIWAYTTVGGYAINDKLGTYIEIYGNLNNKSNNFDLGLTYLINNRLQVDAIFAHNIGGSTARSFGFGIAWKTGSKN